MKTTVKKKTYNLDEEMIGRVRKLYDTKTDTEAIQTALKKAIDDRQVEDSLERLLREGRFRTVYR
jgi:Arc/MetJ family transcription regulator